MKLHLHRPVAILGFVLLALQPLLSQRGPELGVWLGSSQYFGDLNNLYRFDQPGLAGGITGRYNFDSRIAARMQLNYHRLAGDDAHSRNAFDLRRNLSFFANVFELATALEFNFFPLRHGSREDFITPYMYGGYSFFYYQPMTHYQGESVSLRELGTEGQLPGQEYNEIAGAWLIGGGLKVDISSNWSLNLDLGYRLASTDYLDDVSGYFPDYLELQTNRGDLAVALADRSVEVDGLPAIGRTGTQRGDHRERDAFLNFGVNLVCYFGKLRCPPISYPKE
ncbi:MAG: outer membrane beta-barrel protein [Saprospiraceae bacterium]|jgi:hypothetical protein|nr:outer membrane beta-barrel protein [Saprospiraceae bacterium]MBP9210114.1 outer membrane beta-barrel protein [Saprospiraceae bacterium]